MTPVVLLHPLGVDHTFWDSVLPLLEGAEAVAPDLLGHGGAPVPPAGATVSTYADAVLETCLAGGLDEVDLVGFSLGGLVAQEIAARRPDLVRRLVLVGTVVSYAEPMRRSWRERAEVARSDGLEPLASPMAQMWFTEGFRSGSPEVVDEVRRLFLGMDPEAYARTCEALENADTTEALGSVTAPTLVACGENDAPPFREAAAVLVERLPDTRLLWLNGQHAVVLEQPDRFAAALREFLGLAGHSSSPSRRTSRTAT